MDTVLNLGLNDQTVEGLANLSGDARFAYDSYRRFIQMYSDVVLELDHGAFEEALEIAKEDRGFFLDTELSAEDLKALVGEYKSLVEADWGKPFPQDVHDQLWGAVGAVFGSWQSERAKVYRRLNDIPADWGTAVNVQQMVFGNKGERSCSGVAFSRDEITGAPEPSGEYLVNAQGEDVVAGIRTPRPIREDGSGQSLQETMPEAYEALQRVRERLERRAAGAADVHARDRGVAERQHRGAELVLAEAADVVEVAQLGQRVGEARHGRLGQAGAMGDLLVAQHAFAGMEGAENVEATGQRGDELPVLGRHAFAQTVLGRALESRCAGDEVADIAHVRSLL